MAHQSYEEQKALVFRGLMLLGVITLVEVFLALLLRGHLFMEKYEEGSILHYVYMLVMVSFSLYKAYFIVFKFMHMEHEVKGLAMTVLLPTTLLIWAVIAFFQEGKSWGERRQEIKDADNEQISPTVNPGHSSIYHLKSSDFNNLG